MCVLSILSRSMEYTLLVSGFAPTGPPVLLFCQSRSAPRRRAALHSAVNCDEDEATQQQTLSDTQLNRRIIGGAVPTTIPNHDANASSSRLAGTDGANKNRPVKGAAAETRIITSRPRHRPSPHAAKTPERVEEELSLALDSLKLAVACAAAPARHDNRRLHTAAAAATSILLFPTARECNAALAAFGDARDLLRALRVFGKMRKAATLRHTLLQRQQPQQAHGRAVTWPVPAPTLVTYSTLMSRFVKANKPVVALRLWNLMIHSNQSGPPLLIDVRAANILMNCYAKLANVEAAERLLGDMKQQHQQQEEAASAAAAEGCRIRLPPPNSVTYNTFLSACHKAGDLDAAVAAVADMRAQRLQPDALSYTSLIATVARRPSKAAGRNDPTPAFQFLRDMHDQRIQPNGMTYSALIDACGRCRRSDLALQGLRMMLRQKAMEVKELSAADSSRVSGNGANYTLSGEVGAWTAAVNACGKAGRLDTAVRLFFAMDNFGVQPNAVTCGSLTDSLLRAGRTAETLEVLRYMKRAGVRPSEVMYTSLMSRAEKLVEMERQSLWQQKGRDRPLIRVDSDGAKTTGADPGENTKAIEVYTELIDSLIRTEGATASLRKDDWRAPHRAPVRNSKSLLLMKVFLVFQEMKVAGVQVDVPCYNALLRACAQAGDATRAQEVIRTMLRDDLDPNDMSWRLLLRSASSVAIEESDQRSGTDIIKTAESVWRQALSHRRSQRRIDDQVSTQWIPSVDSFVALISVYMRAAETTTTGDGDTQLLYRRVVQLYHDVLMSHDDMGMNRIDLILLHKNQRAMMVVLHAIVSLEYSLRNDVAGDGTRRGLRSTARSILELDCFLDDRLHAVPPSTRWGSSARRALQTARSWAS